MSRSEDIICDSGLKFELVERFGESALRRCRVSSCGQADQFVGENIKGFSEDGMLVFRTAQRVEKEIRGTDFFGNRTTEFMLAPPELWVCDNITDSLGMFRVLRSVGFLKAKHEALVAQVAGLFESLNPVQRCLFPSVCETEFVCLDNLGGDRLERDFIRSIVESNLRVFELSMEPAEFKDALSIRYDKQFVTIGRV